MHTYTNTHTQTYNETELRALPSFKTCMKQIAEEIYSFKTHVYS